MVQESEVFLSYEATSFFGGVSLSGVQEDCRNCIKGSQVQGELHCKDEGLNENQGIYGYLTLTPPKLVNTPSNDTFCLVSALFKSTVSVKQVSYLTN